MNCPHCSSTNISYKGFGNGIEYWHCNDCHNDYTINVKEIYYASDDS